MVSSQLADSLRNHCGKMVAIESNENLSPDLWTDFILQFLFPSIGCSHDGGLFNLHLLSFFGAFQEEPQT